MIFDNLGSARRERQYPIDGPIKLKFSGGSGCMMSPARRACFFLNELYAQGGPSCHSENEHPCAFSWTRHASLPQRFHSRFSVLLMLVLCHTFWIWFDFFFEL